MSQIGQAPKHLVSSDGVSFIEEDPITETFSRLSKLIVELEACLRHFMDPGFEPSEDFLKRCRIALKMSCGDEPLPSCAHAEEEVHLFDSLRKRLLG